MAALRSPEPNPQPSLLIVDGEPKARSALVAALRQRGYRVEETGSGPEALARLELATYDLLLLDLGVPGVSGVDLLLRARLMCRDLPIILLTAQATLDSAIAAVKADVIDYVLKPYKTNDLLVTISRALAERAEQQRRQHLLEMVGEAMSALQQLELKESVPPPASNGNGAVKNLVQVGTLALDPEKRTVILQTDPPRTIELTEGEASILMTLMEKPNEVFSYSQLAKKALGYEGMDKWTVESVIRSSVFRLRQKIEPGPNAPHLICTVRGRGYYFSPALS